MVQIILLAVVGALVSAVVVCMLLSARERTRFKGTHGTHVPLSYETTGVGDEFPEHPDTGLLFNRREGSGYVQYVYDGRSWLRIG